MSVSDMGNQGDPAPQDASSAAEFVAMMLQLKQQSGLTYRQLEERGAQHGVVLPRSTLADVLRHSSLPREDTVTAFLRACGEERHTEAWLQARNRIAAAGDLEGSAQQDEGPSERQPPHEEFRETRPSETQIPRVANLRGGQRQPPPRDPAADDSRSRRGLSSVHGSRGWLIGAVMTAVLVCGGYLATELSDGGESTGSDGVAESAEMSTPPGTSVSSGPAGSSASPAPPPGPYRIRSAASSLCLSEREGDDAGYVYQSGCRGGIPTYALEAIGDGTYRIRSLHPVLGHGCLGVAGASTVKGARMMDDYCGHRGTAERYRLQPTRTPVRGYRIRPLHSKDCVSVPGSAKREWIPVLQLPCASGDTGQIFRFDPVPSPSAIPTMTSN